MKIYGGGGRRVNGSETKVTKPETSEISENHSEGIKLDRRLLFDDTLDALWDEVNRDGGSSAETSTNEPDVPEISEPESPAKSEAHTAPETPGVHRVGALPSYTPRQSADKVHVTSAVQQKPAAPKTVYRWVDDEDVVYTSSRQTDAPAAKAEAPAQKKPIYKAQKKRRKKWPWVVSIIAGLCAFLYCFVVFFPTPFVRKWRDIWIETAMSTMTHQWLATAFFPESLIDDVLSARYELQEYQKDMISDKDMVKITTAAISGVTRETATSSGTTENSSAAQSSKSESAAATSEKKSETTQTTTLKSTAPKTTKDPNLRWLDPEDSLYLYFPEIEPSTFYDYAVKHGDDIWDKDGYLFIDKADRDSKGTTIKTKSGDTVKALDTRNGILIINVTGDGFQGILAIVRNPAQVSLAVSTKYGSVGQRIPTLCKNNNAILGMNASGFEDPDGKGNGGNAYGYVMSNGQRYHKPERSDWFIMGFDYDNILYTGKYSKLDRDLRDAMEFEPLLINNGKIACTKNDGWGINPRASIGQCADGSVLMLVINGRSASSVGCRCIDMANILYEYGGVQACTVDGGSSAVMYYNGRVITYPSGGNKTEGRQLPDAWVVSKVV